MKKKKKKKKKKKTLKANKFFCFTADPIFRGRKGECSFSDMPVLSVFAYAKYFVCITKT